MIAVKAYMVTCWFHGLFLPPPYLPPTTGPHPIARCDMACFVRDDALYMVCILLLYSEDTHCIHAQYNISCHEEYLMFLHYSLSIRQAIPLPLVDGRAGFILSSTRGRDASRIALKISLLTGVDVLLCVIGCSPVFACHR